MASAGIVIVLVVFFLIRREDLRLAVAGITSVYGAAGSIVIVLLWVYYSPQAVLFGAEFTRVYAQHRGARLEPKECAVRVSPEAHV